MLFPMVNQSSFFGRSLKSSSLATSAHGCSGTSCRRDPASADRKSRGAGNPSVRATYLYMFAKKSIDPATSISSFFGLSPRSFGDWMKTLDASRRRSERMATSGPLARSCRSFSAHSASSSCPLALSRAKRLSRLTTWPSSVVPPPRRKASVCAAA
jgi:hypothetical protein